ncbi:hypothetical protein HDU96_008070 [Phlyctochytrium bullatum]|nr:hypothetical protein HDU96_008070 [Phlyctochytrium bullatum]
MKRKEHGDEHQTEGKASKHARIEDIFNSAGPFKNISKAKSPFDEGCNLSEYLRRREYSTHVDTFALKHVYKHVNPQHIIRQVKAPDVHFRKFTPDGQVNLITRNLDKITYQQDYILLPNHAGVAMHQDVMAITSVQNQCIFLVHIKQCIAIDINIKGKSSFLSVRTIGWHNFEDDGILIDVAAKASRDFSAKRGSSKLREPERKPREVRRSIKYP